KPPTRPRVRKYRASPRRACGNGLSLLEPKQGCYQSGDWRGGQDRLCYRPFSMATSVTKQNRGFRQIENRVLPSKYSLLARPDSSGTSRYPERLSGIVANPDKPPKQS